MVRARVVRWSAAAVVIAATACTGSEEVTAGSAPAPGDAVELPFFPSALAISGEAAFAVDGGPETPVTLWRLTPDAATELAELPAMDSIDAEAVNDGVAIAGVRCRETTLLGCSETIGTVTILDGAGAVVGEAEVFSTPGAPGDTSGFPIVGVTDGVVWVSAEGELVAIAADTAAETERLAAPVGDPCVLNGEVRALVSSATAAGSAFSVQAWGGTGWVDIRGTEQRASSQALGRCAGDSFVLEEGAAPVASWTEAGGWQPVDPARAPQAAVHVIASSGREYRAGANGELFRADRGRFERTSVTLPAPAAGSGPPRGLAVADNASGEVLVCVSARSGSQCTAGEA